MIVADNIYVTGLRSGKADSYMMIFEPGDLPFIGTGVYPDHEELVVLLIGD